MKENKQVLLFAICITTVIFLMWWANSMGFQAGVEYCANY
jgi:hypothetical protein